MMADQFGVLDKLANAIVFGVELDLGAHERAILRRKPTRNMNPRELYQRRMFEFVKYNKDGDAATFDLYHVTIAIGSDFALPQADLDRWYWAKVIAERLPNSGANMGAEIRQAAQAITCRGLRCNSAPKARCHGG